MQALKASLKGGRRVTDALYEAGYGSVSRFDERPQLGMKATEYRASGRGQRVSYAVFELEIGNMLLAATPRGLCAVKLGDDARLLRRQLAEEFSAAELVEDPGVLREFKERISSFVQGKARLDRVPLDIRGTVFQKKVWDALRRIPRGETRTYQQIAREIGAPRAVRAVGSACGANPVALVVPCHRALRRDGGLGGYAWGIERKRKLLELEQPKKK